MPLLKWASAVLNGTNSEDREKMQAIFDTAFWTLSTNHKLQPDSVITLMEVVAKSSAPPKYAFAYCQGGKWTADLK